MGYKAKVSKIDGIGTYVTIPALGVRSQYGPCPNVSGDYSIGDWVWIEEDRKESHSFTVVGKLNDSVGQTPDYEEEIPLGNEDQYYRGDKTWQNLNKWSVGLGNVDNTSDADKPISGPQSQMFMNQLQLIGDKKNIYSTRLFDRDLDIVTTPGSWEQHSNSNYPLETLHYPVSIAGMLVVESNTAGTILTQTYTAYNGLGQYIRQRTTAGWNSWVRIDNKFIGIARTLTTNFNITANATYTTVPMAQSRHNAGGFTYSAGKITVPLTGYYRINAQLRWITEGTTGSRYTGIFINDTLAIASGVPASTESNANTSVAYTTLLTAGAVVDIRGYQSSGGATTVVPTDNSTTFEMAYVGV